MVFHSVEAINLNSKINSTQEVFSVNRSGKPFSEVAVGIELEETMLMPRLKGIMKYANFATTVNKLTVTNYMKFELLNNLLKMYGISESSSGLKETQLPRKKRKQRCIIYQEDKNWNREVIW